VSHAHGILAEVHDAMGHHEEALSSARKAIETAEKAGAPVPLSFAHTEAGKALVHMRRPDDALPHFESALAHSISSNARHARFLAHYHLWKVFEELGNDERAELERQAAFHFAQDLDGADPELKDVRQLREDPDLDGGAAHDQTTSALGAEISDPLAGAHGSGGSWS
jgi:tetratricopeptide (TPR) repeat protein